MSALSYAGRSQDERYAARKKAEQPSQQVAGGSMAVPGTESDSTHSCGELSEEGKRVWRSAPDGATIPAGSGQQH